MITIFHSADGLKIMKDNGDISSTTAGVLYNGTVLFVTAANFLAQCLVNVKYYPFDAQECELIVSELTLIDFSCRHLRSCKWSLILFL